MNELNKENNVEGTINAVSGLVDKVPVYQDAVQPLAQETGKALGTLGRTVNAALTPVKGLVWGIEKIEEFVHTRVSKKLEKVPPENIQTPDLSVAGPALESLKYTGHKESLSDLYANLLATSMDKNTARSAHPGFVEIIRNLSSDEARILSKLVESRVIPLVDIRRESTEGKGGATIQSYLTVRKYIGDCEHEELTSTYLKNLERLGLIDIPKDMELTADGVYDPIINSPNLKTLIETLNNTPGYKAELQKYYAAASALGELFIEACVQEK